MTKKEIRKLKNCERQKMVCEAQLMELLAKSKEIPLDYTRHHYNLKKQMGKLRKQIEMFDKQMADIKEAI
jgi:hypothetical protein